MENVPYLLKLFAWLQVLEEEEQEEVLTRGLYRPLTSCQEDRLGLDYLYGPELCHG